LALSRAPAGQVAFRTLLRHQLEEHALHRAGRPRAERVTATPEYAQEPLEIDAKCELMIKADRLLTLLEALRLCGASRQRRRPPGRLDDPPGRDRSARRAEPHDGLRKRANRTEAAAEGARAPVDGDRQRALTTIEAPAGVLSRSRLVRQP
jgi:hypothetical protein